VDSGGRVRPPAGDPLGPIRGVAWSPIVRGSSHGNMLPLPRRINQMPRFAAIAHVQWELPFPLRLPPRGFPVWEPEEGVAIFDPTPAVGTLAWRRSSDVVRVEDVFPDPGRGIQTYPRNDYRITAPRGDGRETIIAELQGGRDGGFREPRGYCVANILLCLRINDDTSRRAAKGRAEACLNNVLDAYRLLTVDPLVRSILATRDAYYTLVSIARTPETWAEMEPLSALRRLSELQFGEAVGADRLHEIGLNSLEDLFPTGPMDSSSVRTFADLASRKQDVDVFHHLAFSAVRRLRRYEWSLAVLDAQSAFESLVSSVLVEALGRLGADLKSIGARIASPSDLGLLQRRLNELDRIAAAEATAAGEPVRRFQGSPQEANWRRDLYALRHRVVHEGLREVSFDDAKSAVIAGLKAARCVQDLRPAFRRPIMWDEQSLELRHVRQTSGRLSRLFEA
jgi:hypothetical protein